MRKTLTVAFLSLLVAVGLALAIGAPAVAGESGGTPNNCGWCADTWRCPWDPCPREP